MYSPQSYVYLTLEFNVPPAVKGLSASMDSTLDVGAADVLQGSNSPALIRLCARPFSAVLRWK